MYRICKFLLAKALLRFVSAIANASSVRVCLTPLEVFICGECAMIAVCGAPLRRSLCEQDDGALVDTVLLK